MECSLNVMKWIEQDTILLMRSANKKQWVKHLANILPRLVILIRLIGFISNKW